MGRDLRDERWPSDYDEVFVTVARDRIVEDERRQFITGFIVGACVLGLIASLVIAAAQYL